MKTLRLLPLLVLGAALATEQGPQVARVPVLPADGPVGDLILFTQKYTNLATLKVGPNDANVASLAARLLQQAHYSRHPLDEELTGRFFHRYLELLDGQHFHFLQADLQEFEHYRHNLGELILRKGDTSPANDIFARFLCRVEQRVEYVADLLRTETFEFTGSDRYAPSRKGTDWPADLEAAKGLWRQHLRYEYLQEKLNKHKPEEALKTLSNRYKRLIRTLAEFDSDGVLELYLTALSQGYDPHSDYMGKAQLDNFAISMKLSLFGIGALLRSEDGYVTIQELVPGGPAVKSKKLKPNDKIVAVQHEGEEAVDVVDMKLNKVVEMIRGPKGTPVTLTIIPADAADSSVRQTLTLVRDEIKLEDQQAKAKLFEAPAAEGKNVRLGLIELPSFYATFDLGSSKDKSEPRSTTADVTRLLKKLVAEKVAGVILDLRRNGGGSLEEAIKLAGVFIPKGPVVQVRDANNEVAVESDPDPGVVYDGPLVVLTGRFSASASEIVAGALQDYGRALVVGDSGTHGKGTVQTIYELSRFTRFHWPTNYNPGALKVTIRKFYRVTGASTQLRGITPDIVLPSVSSYLEVGEGSQEFALGWDTIPSAEFERADRLQPCLEELRKRSTARLEQDPEAAYLREDIDLYRKFLADKSVSLNEEQRVKEKAETEARIKARKQARATRPPSQEKVYEVTLKQVDEPGLPAPLAKGRTPGRPEAGETAAAHTEPGAATAQAAASTNAAAVDVEAAEDNAEDHTPAVDAALDESKRILLDLINLLAGTRPLPPVTANN